MGSTHEVDSHMSFRDERFPRSPNNLTNDDCLKLINKMGQKFIKFNLDGKPQDEFCKTKTSTKANSEITLPHLMFFLNFLLIVIYFIVGCVFFRVDHVKDEHTATESSNKSTQVFTEATQDETDSNRVDEPLPSNLKSKLTGSHENLDDMSMVCRGGSSSDSGASDFQEIELFNTTENTELLRAIPSKRFDLDFCSDKALHIVDKASISTFPIAEKNSTKNFLSINVENVTHKRGNLELLSRICLACDTRNKRSGIPVRKVTSTNKKT